MQKDNYVKLNSDKTFSASISRNDKNDIKIADIGILDNFEKNFEEENLNTAFKETVTILDLPSQEQFIKDNEPSVLWYKPEKWSEPKYICPQCNEGSMRKENNTVYTSMPPCYKYQCDKCGYTTFHHF